MTIRTKMVGSVAVTMLLVAGGIALSPVISSQRKDIVRDGQARFAELADSVVASLTSIMNMGDTQEVVSFFSHFDHLRRDRGEETPRITVGNNEEKVVWANDPERVGSPLPTVPGEVFEDRDGWFRITTPVRLSASCLKCHEGKIGETFGTILLEQSSGEVHRRFEENRNTFMLFAGALILVAAGAIMMLLKFLVFDRVDAIIETTTHVVGGDFDRPIVQHSSDELGHLEKLIEQFRLVFTNLLAQQKRKDN